MLVTSQHSGENGVQLSATAEVDKVETLRHILAVQQQREVGYDEAREIGTALLDFYEILAEEVYDESAD